MSNGAGNAWAEAHRRAGAIFRALEEARTRDCEAAAFRYARLSACVTERERLGEVYGVLQERVGVLYRRACEATR